METKRILREKVNFMWLMVLLCLFLFGLAGLLPRGGLFLSEAGAEEDEISTIELVYTSGANGLLMQCSCPGKSGGLARRAQFIREYRQEHSQVLVLDSGDNLPAGSDHLRSSYVLRAWELIGYDAALVGDQELMSGGQFFLEAQEKYDLPFIAANLQISSGEVPFSFPPYVIKEVGNHRLAIVGVTSDASHLLAKRKIGGLKFSSWQDVLSRYLPVLEEKADLIVILSHLGTELDLKMAAEFPEIDVIIGGHGTTLIKKPLVAGETLIVHPGAAGQKVGVLTLSLDGIGRIVDYQNKLVSLSKKIKNDPEIVSLDRDYKRELKERHKVLLMQKQDSQ